MASLSVSLDRVFLSRSIKKRGEPGKVCPALPAAVRRLTTALNRIASMRFSSRHTGADTTPLKVDPKALAQDTAAVAGLAYILANQ